MSPVSEDISLTGAPLFRGEEVPLRHVADVDQIQTGVDVRRGASGSGSRRRALPVGVGFTSSSPTGVDGFTITTGSPFAAQLSATRSASNLLFL